MESKKYLAIKADIINSRQSNDRNKVQKSLSNALENINESYATSIASKFMITSGDGFQGLMTTGIHLFDIIGVLESAVAPLKLRFGIGIGTISTDINVENSAVIDGQSYHHADAMLTQVEILEGQYSSLSTNVLIQSETQHDGLLNALFSLRYVVKSSWTNRQSEVIQVFISMNEKQYETAEKLKVNQSTISRTLKSTDYFSLKEAEKEVVKFIEGMML